MLRKVQLKLAISDLQRQSQEQTATQHDISDDCAAMFAEGLLLTRDAPVPTSSPLCVAAHEAYRFILAFVFTACQRDEVEHILPRRVRVTQLLQH